MPTHGPLQISKWMGIIECGAYWSLSSVDISFALSSVLHVPVCPLDIGNAISISHLCIIMISDVCLDAVSQEECLHGTLSIIAQRLSSRQHASYTVRFSYLLWCPLFSSATSPCFWDTWFILPVVIYSSEKIIRVVYMLVLVCSSCYHSALII